MSNNWTEKNIKQLKKNKMIRDYRIHPKVISPNKITKEEKRSAEKDWILLNLQYWCNERAVSLLEEHKFDQPSQLLGHEVPARLWRFDFAIPAYKIAIEYEGIFSEKSGHTTIKGFVKDVQKYNRAAELGWKVIRCTAADYKNVIKTLNNCIQ